MCRIGVVLALAYSLLQVGCQITPIQAVKNADIRYGSVLKADVIRQSKTSIVGDQMNLSIETCSINSAKMSLERQNRNDRDIQCIICNVKEETAAGSPPPIDGLETGIKNVINVNAHDVLL